MKKRILCILISVSMLGCDTELEKPNNVPPDDILLATADPTTVKANTNATVNVVARIPKDAGPLDISFKTTAGKFRLTADKSINERADSVSGNYRYANVKLLPDSVPGTSFVTVEVQSIRRRVTITFN